VATSTGGDCTDERSADAGVKAHRASVNGDETARDAGRRATRRQAVRTGPPTEAGLAIFAQVTDRAFTQNDDERRTPANTLAARPSRSQIRSGSHARHQLLP